MRRWGCILMALALAASCSNGTIEMTPVTPLTPAESSPATDGAGESLASTTAPTPRTIPESTTSTVPPSADSPPSDAPPLLVAHVDGVDLWTPIGVTPVITGRPIEIALADLAGGVILEGRTPTSIDIVRRLGDEPEVLFEHGSARWVRPVAVTRIDGSRILVYSKAAVLPNDCPVDDVECMWDYDRTYLILRDLDGATETNLGMTGSFESSGVGFSFGGEFVAITFSPYGEPFVCSAIIPLNELLDGASPDRWLGEGSDLLEEAGLSFVGCKELSRAVLAPDGASWAEVLGGSGSGEVVQVVIRENPSGAEISRAEIGGPTVYPSWIAFDGTHILVGREDSSQPGSALDRAIAPVLVDSDGSVTELEIQGRAEIWPIPDLQVAQPAYNEHVTERYVRFAGTTDPGCTVTAAGSYPALVGDDGTWSVTLVLNPGANVARFEAAAPDGRISELRHVVYYDPPLALRADGLGSIDFGTQMEEAVKALTGLLGPPAWDETYEADPKLGGEVFVATGYPARTSARFLHWERPELMVMLSDAEGFGDDRFIHFNGWIYSGPGEWGPELTTGSGVGTGDSVGALMDAYADRLFLPDQLDEITGSWHWSVATDLPSWQRGETLRLHGTLSGDPSDPNAVVTQVSAGWGFDSC